MQLEKCECINITDRGNILFLLRSKIDELDATMIDIDKKKQNARTLEETIGLMDSKTEIKVMKDSLMNTRSRVIDTPICK